MREQEQSEAKVRLELVSASEEIVQSFSSTIQTAKTKVRRTKESAGSDMAADSFLGSKIGGKYEILDLLGQGGMSSVYRAEHLLTKKIVAIKMMHHHLMMNPQSMRRFQQEAMAASRLSHANVIAVHDLGVSDDGQPFLVMDYLEGVSLHVAIECGLLPVERTLPILLQVCAALQHAHQHGVVHRDLKPSNIMLVRDDDGGELVKVVDFGIAKIVDDADGAMDITRTGEVFGSPLYMSPEQWLGQKLDVRSDVFSTGCVMYELLTGAAPFAGSNVFETMYKQVHELPAGFSDLDMDIRLAKQLEQIAFKAMAKDPQARYDDMKSMREDLTNTLSFSGDGSRLVASATLRYNELWRGLANKWGTIGRVLFILATFVVAAAIVVAGVVSPAFTTERLPAREERNVAWHAAASSLVSNLQEFRNKEMCFKMLKHESRNLHGFISAESLYTTKNLAEFYRMAGRYELAISTFKDAVIIARQLNLTGTLDFAELNSGRAECYYHMGNLLQAKSYCTLALETYQQLKYSYTADELIDIAILAQFCDSHDRAREARQRFEKLESAWSQHSARFDLVRTNWVICLTADFFARHGELDKAENMYLDALTRWRLMHGRAQMDAGWTLHQLGMLSLKRGDLAKAEERLKAADATFVDCNGERSLPRAYALLDWSDLQWQNCRWWEALQNRALAAKILSQGEVR